MNSLWGLIWFVASQTGWTPEIIIHGISWVNLRMMMADMPKTEKKQEQKEASDDDLDALSDE